MAGLLKQTINDILRQTMMVCLVEIPSALLKLDGHPQDDRSRPLQPNSALKRNFQRFTHRAIHSPTKSVEEGQNWLERARQSLIGRNEMQHNMYSVSHPLVELSWFESD